MTESGRCRWNRHPEERRVSWRKVVVVVVVVIVVCFALSRLLSVTLSLKHFVNVQKRE